jgi:hypothetical protein
MAQGMKKVGKALGGTKQYNKNKGKELRVGGGMLTLPLCVSQVADSPALVFKV